MILCQKIFILSNILARKSARWGNATSPCPPPRALPYPSCWPPALGDAISSDAPVSTSELLILTSVQALTEHRESNMQITSILVHFVLHVKDNVYSIYTGLHLITLKTSLSQPVFSFLVSYSWQLAGPTTW